MDLFRLEILFLFLETFFKLNFILQSLALIVEHSGCGALFSFRVWPNLVFGASAHSWFEVRHA